MRTPHNWPCSQGQDRVPWKSMMVSVFSISLENVWFTTTFILSGQQSSIPCIFPLAFPSTSLLTCYSKNNEQRMKTTTCRVGTLKNQQKRWEHDNTFTSSLRLVQFFQLCRPKMLVFVLKTFHTKHWVCGRLKCSLLVLRIFAIFRLCHLMWEKIPSSPHFPYCKWRKVWRGLGMRQVFCFGMCPDVDKAPVVSSTMLSQHLPLHHIQFFISFLRHVYKFWVDEDVLLLLWFLAWDNLASLLAYT